MVSYYYNMITERQKQLLSIIYNYIKDFSYPPTFEEMREKLSVASNQAVIDLLSKLEKSKVIKRENSSARSIAILPLGYEILGKTMVRIAGASYASSFLESFQSTDFKWIEIATSMLPNEAIKQSNDVFVIQVHGDSMINAGIDDGDMLLVKKAKEFKSGDIVLASNNDGTTVKRFIADGGKRYLKPENSAYSNIPIIPGEVRFEGKIVLNLNKIS